MNTWKPIESAPKDGQEVLICEGRAQYVAWYCPDLEGWYHEVGSCVYDPTHWMPLPQPPLLNPANTPRARKHS